MVPSEENESLLAPFLEAEIKKHYAEGADQVLMDSLSFFTKSFGIQLNDLVHLFDDFQKSKLDLFRLNCALVTLIPKVGDASNMKQFIPIRLLN